MNDGRTKWIVQKNEKNYRFLKTNIKITIDLDRSWTILFVFYYERILWKKKRYSFLWTNYFIERLFSEKTNEKDGKLTIILRTNEIKYSFTIEKNEMGGSWTINEQIEKKERANLYPQDFICSNANGPGDILGSECWGAYMPWFHDENGLSINVFWFVFAINPLIWTLNTFNCNKK